MSDVDVGRLYRENRERLTAVVRPVPQEQLLWECPACPGWSVHDVVAHVTGVATDAIAGRLGGVPSPEQTAAQVDERRGIPTTVVLREWERSASQFELVLSKAGPSLLAAAIDVAVHEHDIRGALDLPGERESETITIAVARTVERWAATLRSRGLPPVAIVTPQGTPRHGDPTAAVRWTATEYDIFRTAFGRRSADQFARAFTGDDPESYLHALVVFGITPIDLVD